MGYYASGYGQVTLNFNHEDKKNFDIVCEIEDALSDIFNADILKSGNKSVIYLSESGSYHEDDTLEVLNSIANYLEDGRLDYSGEEESVWRFVFMPDTKQWVVESATIDYDFESYSDEDMIEELKNRGYQVVNNKPEDIYNSLDNTVRDSLYRLLWSDYVKSDINAVLEQHPDAPEDDDKYEAMVNDITRSYVYEGDYDCNLSYWDNINNLIDKYIA